MTVKKSNPTFVMPKTSTGRAVALAEVIKSGDTIGASMDAICQAERKARKGQDVGTVKSGDEFMVQLNKSLIALGYAGSTLLNKQVAVRKAINEGKAFEHKPYAKPKAKGAKPAQGAKGKQAKTSKAGLTITLSGEPKAEEIAGAFRSFLNKLKGNDKYATLASFMIDGLDEFDGE
jgi:hypothetical protein